MTRQRGYDQQPNRWNVDPNAHPTAPGQGQQDRWGIHREWDNPRYARDNHDEFPDGGRGVYPHDHRSSASREQDRQFIEAVYGPHRERTWEHPATYQPGYGRSDVVGSNWSHSAGSDAGNDVWGAESNAMGYQSQSQSFSSEPYRGPYRGKGPKGYERSDERIKELVCERLTEAPALDASDITVEVINREVTLAGVVASRFAKHLAEDLVESVWGIGEINNQLKLSPQDGSVARAVES